jgi:uncharacterized protein (TIGR02246 family)
VTRAFRVAAVVLAAALLLVPAGLHAQATATTPRAQIQRLVRDYMAAHNQADATAMMELMARAPEVTSISMGEITRGWEAIRTDTDEMTGQEGRYRFAVGTMDVTLLGASHALVVAPTSITAASAQGEVQLRGAMTLVLVKQSQGWRILNEHFSIKPPE